jgi:hypothetical protein
MTNDTVRADARPMPSSRRALLGSILAVGAAASVPAAAAIVSTGCADAELFALQPAIEAADRRDVAALDARSRAEESYFAARQPRPARPESGLDEEEWFQTFARKMREYNAEPKPEWAAYEAAVEAWEDEDERIRVETGEMAASERSTETVDEACALRDRIVAIRATTLAGLKFKAKYALEHYADNPDEEVMQSIAEDLLAIDLAGGRAA